MSESHSAASAIYRRVSQQNIHACCFLDTQLQLDRQSALPCKGEGVKALLSFEIVGQKSLTRAQSREKEDTHDWQ